MMLAMNRVGYDAMVVGNHEFNFGLRNLAAARETARFPWLSANTRTDGTVPPFAPFLVKTVGGVKVAVVGVTTSAIPEWEKPSRSAGSSGSLPRRACGARSRSSRGRSRTSSSPRSTGPRPRPRNGGEAPRGEARENSAWQIAERIPRLAAVIYGHTHRREEGRRVGPVLLVQPRNWPRRWPAWT